MTAPVDQVGALWQPLLVELTAHEPGMVVWKHLGRALAGQGDVDTMVVPRSLDSATTAMVDAAGKIAGAQAIIVCRCVPGLQKNLILTERTWPRVMQLDYMFEMNRAGCRWAQPEDVLSVAHVIQGIRQLPPTIEAVAGIVIKALGWTGAHAPSEGTLSALRQPLMQDPAGARLAIEVLIPARVKQPMEALVRAVAEDRWTPELARSVWLHFLRTSLDDPSYLGRRLRFRAALAWKRCPAAFISDDTRRAAPSESPEAFIALVGSPNHEVLSL